VRRKPFQDSPTPSANSVAAIALMRLHAFTDDSRYHAFAQKVLEAFAGIAPQYGLFAATYGLAATLFAHHPLQVVVTGRADDPAAQALESAAQRVYRFGKSVRGCAEGDAPASSGGQGRGSSLRRPILPPADHRSHPTHRVSRKWRGRGRRFVIR
jgi:uncharacterized protein YyaL (SSP411 family)